MRGNGITDEATRIGRISRILALLQEHLMKDVKGA